MMWKHTGLSKSELHAEIRRGAIAFGGHRPSKIYGTLRCGSGRLMKPAHRVFFSTSDVAHQLGYRPCARCLPQHYKIWKHDVV